MILLWENQASSLRFLCLLAIALTSPPTIADGDMPQNPAMSSALSFDAQPIQFAISQIGSINVQGVITGIGMHQTNPVNIDNAGLVDVSNAQVIIQKNQGLLQFYLQSGYYSTPSLGTSYQRANVQTIDSFGVVPLASISLAPTRNWLFTLGKINSFGGYENTFTFQNINIDRGLLWNQTSNVSKGMSAAYSDGDVEAAITWNDGFYSNQLNWLGASATYHLNDKNNVSVSWTGSIKASTVDTFITPLAQNNSQITNAIYTYKSDRWLVAPYLQYTYVPKNPSIGILNSSQTLGAALLTNYRFSNKDIGGFSLPFRFEYISSGGNNSLGAPNLLYGVGSDAWSATLTPTYQVGKYFLRGELSYVQAINISPGLAFGNQGNSANQARAMLEVGVLY
jgi:hypothetical protein